MKASVFYHSVSGKTKDAAEIIVAGMNAVEGVEAKAFSITDFDKDWASASQCVVVGTPIYMATLSGELKVWLEKVLPSFGLAGKLGGAFATEAYIHGGGEAGIRTILDHMMCYGMMTYSAGGAKGNPVIHLGPVSVNQYAADCAPTFEIYGKRMAEQALHIYGA
ncbi:MAG: NAD(P)H-dependent oxidoreductase [Eubacteriales bacterium]